MEDAAASSSPSSSLPAVPGENRPQISVTPTVRAALQAIVQTWTHSTFGAREAAQHLGLSHRSAARILQAGVEEGILRIEGAGRSTLYRVVPLKDSSVRGTSKV